MFPDLYSETDKNEIKFLLGFYLLLKKMTLFSSDLKLHLLHYFQQQILSEYFNVICKTKRLYFFFYLGIGVQRRNLDIFLYGIQLLNIVLTTF